MFQFFEPIPDHTFNDHTLILPAVSVGNVGQLVTDLLTTNLKNCKKVGRIFHPGLEPVVGNDISQDGQVSLMTSCEIFHDPEKKLVLLQFHAPILSKRTEDFVNFLVDWVKKCKFEQAICLSSTFASQRIDSQLIGPPFRYLTSSSIPSALRDSFADLKWKQLEVRQFPAPPVYDDIDHPAGSGSGSGSAGEIYIPGSGITRPLLEACEANQLPIAVLLMFVSEGDNTHDAKLYFGALDQLFHWVADVSEVKDKNKNKNKEDEYQYFYSTLSHFPYKIPATWIHLFGPSHPPEIY